MYDDTFVLPQLVFNFNITLWHVYFYKLTDQQIEIGMRIHDCSSINEKKDVY